MIGRRLFVVFLVGVTVLSAIVANAQRASSGSASAVRVGDAPETAAAGAVELQVVESEGASAPQPATLAIESGAGPSVAGAFAETGARREYRARESRTTYDIEITGAADSGALAELGLTASTPGTQRYSVSREQLIGLRERGIGLRVLGGKTTHVFAAGGPMAEGATAITPPTVVNSTGHYTLSSGTLNRPVPDQGWASLGLTVIGFGAPAGSTTTRLSYRLRIHNDADPYAFWCSDYRIFLSSTATGGAAPSVLVYENLGDQTDLGFDDDPEDDYDIYLDWRTTHAFDGQDPNQTWFVYVTDDLQDDTGFIEYVEFDVYWDGPDDLVASDVYFRTAAAGGGTRVDNPVIGQELYPHIDFVVAGAAASGRLWALDLDGTALCEATDTLAADAYTGWCASPVTITEGNHTLRGRVDPDGTITEGDETNNEATRNFTVALLTDLLATDVYFRTAAAGGGVRVDSPREGQQLYLHADYAVAHTGTSGTLWELTLDATPLCDLTTSAATGSYVGWCNSPVTITAGSHQAQLIVDPLAAISEASESNNVASRTFSIAPDIRVNPLTLSFLGSGNTVPTAGPGAAAPGAEVRGATATPRRDRRIHLRSGSFDPLEHGQSAAGYDAGAAVAVASASAGRHVVLQFESTVSPEEREALAQRGIRLLRYLPTNAYWAAVEPGAGRLAGTSEGGGVRAAWTLPGEHKLTPELARGAFPRTARQADGRVRVVVRVFDDVAAPEAQAALASVRGAELLELRSERSWLVATTPERIGAIAALDAVESVEPAPGLRAADNLVAAGRIRASDAWAAPYSLSGLGVAVGIWDEDAVASHGDFGARLSVHDAGTPSSHSTHVAGTVGGSGAGNASARGMASQAQLHSWNWDDDALEMRSAAQAGTVDISNHSYGWIAGWYFDGSTWVDEGPALFGAYTSEAADWDALVAETGLLPFKSSGNDRDDGPDWPAGPRTDGPYDTISGQGNAKNLVTVGATTDADGMTSFSSWGPADDGRVKPDVCANGSGLLSTQPGGSYASFSGTSMASPSAAGAAALLQQRYESQTGQRPRPDELKALLLHGAVDLAPAGPDYQCGFGLLDVKASADLVRNGLWRTGSIASTGQAQTFTVAIAAGTPRFKATLVWTDPPGSTSAATALVNDLDVWLESPTGAISRPWVLNGASPSAAATQGENRVDNVEQVVVQSPAAGNWIVHVSGHAVGLGPQPYTIVSEALTAGGSGSSTFTISNDGVATLNVSSITPDQPAPWIQLAPATPLTIAPGGSVTVEVTIDYAQAPVGQTTRRLLIASNDADENPFPGGVYVAVDRPTPPTLAVGDVSLSEGHAGTSVATFTVTLSRAMSNPVTVQYATADDSAVAGVDYVAASGTLTFAPGETSRTFGVTVNGDTAVEIDEAFVVDLSNPVLASIADSRGVGTIRSDEPPPLATWANPVGVAPSGGSLTKTAATSNWDSGAVSVERVAAGNACVEFTATETTTYRAVGLGTGDSNQGIGDIEYSIALVPGAGFWVYESGTVRPAGSGTFVGGDKFAVCVESGVVKYRRNGAVFYASAVAPTYPLRVDTSLYTPGSTVTDARVLGLVEPPPALSVNDVSVSEGNAGTTTATFTVTLAVASASTVTVDYATSNGTASAGSDYAAASGTLTFNPGITSQTFGVTVNGDTAAEFTETFTVTLSNPTNAELGDGTGVGTIVNDDAPPAAMWTNVVGVAPSGASLTKTAGTSNWDSGAVSVQMLSSGDGCVEFTATETTTYRALGLGTGDANQGIGDIEHGIALFPGAGFSVYESGAARTAGSGTFASGDVFSVCVESGVVKYRRNGAPIYTSLVAPSYPLRVDTSLYSPGSTITNVRVLGLVEPPPALSVNDVSVSEGNAGTTTATFTVNLSAASPSPVTVDYATSNGTATAGSDYAAASGTLTFNPGIVSQTFGVTVNGDTAIETNETFTVTLSNATNAAIGDGTGVGTITNDDAPPAAMWTNVVGVAPSGASLTKTAVTSNWDAGAVSVQTLGAGDGCVEFTATETTTYRALGLGTGDANQGIGDIEHGIALVPGAGFWVYESGAARTAGSGTFVGGDRFAVCVESGVVKYRRNGAPFYTSLVAPTYPLRVDTSLYSPGSTLTDVRVTGFSAGLAIDDVSVTEGDAGTTTATFTVTLSQAMPSAVTVDYATSNGTASASTDYASASGTLTFDPGITSQTFDVTVNGDTTVEVTETFTVTLSNPANAEIGDGTGVGTITNDDAPPAAMWTNVVGVAPSGGSLTKTAGTSNWDSGAVSVQRLLSGDGCVEFTATETTTYRAAGLGTGDVNQGIADIEHGIALFPGAGFSVYESGTARTAGSGTFAGGDVFSVCVESGVVKYRRNGTPFYTSAVAPTYPMRVDTSLYSPGSTITNVRVQGLTEPLPALSVDDVSVSEGDAGTTTATFTVTLAVASPSTVTVDYATSNGSATAGSDYASASGTLTFNAGITSQTFDVTVNGDTAVEFTETFTVTLTNPIDAELGDATGVGTITNDDLPPAAMWTNVVGVAPAGGNLTKTAGTSNWDAGAVSVQRLLSGDGCVEFTATETTTYRALGLGTGDANQGIGDIEHGIALVPGAGFWVYESGAARTAGSGTFVGGDRFAVCVESGAVKYRRNGIVFYTSLVPPTYPLRVDTSLYSPGSTLTDVRVQGLTEPLPSLSVDDVSVAEGDAGTSIATFTVTLSGPSSSIVTVDYSTSAGSIPPGSDYASASGTLTFNPGVTTQTFGVTVYGDTAVEFSETFIVTLSNPTNAELADASGVGTIVDDDRPPSAQWTNVVGVAPSGGSLTKTAGTNNWDAGAVSVERLLSGDGCVEFTATETNTYRAAGLGTGDANQGIGDIEYGIALFPGAGFSVYESGTARTAGSGTFFTGDRFGVCVESGVVRYRRNGTPVYTSTVAPTYPLRVDTSLYSPGSTVTDARVLGLSGPLPALSIADVAVAEGNAGTTTATFTVTLATASASTVTVDYATSNGTATAGSDYVAKTGTLTFNPGITSQTFGVTVNGDTAVEFAETFTVTLSGATNAEIADPTGVGTITNDDLPPSALWVNVVGVAPSGGSLTKTAGTSNWDAGASSAQRLASGDGYVEFTATETTTYRALGLGTGDSNQGIGDIEHGIALVPGAGFWVYESGAARTAGSGSFVAGDRFTVGVESGIVKYRRNGVVFYTSAVAPTYPLRVDTSLYTPGSTITDARVQGFSEPPPTLSVADVTVTEGNSGSTNATVTVSLTSAAATTVTVAYATSNGTATAGSDYAAASGTLTFNAGVTSQTFTVLVYGDTVVEPGETIHVTLSSPTNAEISDGSGVVTIDNDDVLPTLSIGDVSLSEGDSGATAATFTVTLSAASASAVTVDYATANGTAVGAVETSQAWSNTANIFSGDGGSGSPYPSTIAVPTLTGGVKKVTVTLHGFSHSWPQDLDVVLVGPGGQRVMLLSDVGESTGVTGLTLTLDDSASTTAPSTLVSGTYRPTNQTDGDGSDDLFPAPAPVAPYTTALSVFAGVNPTGTWSLYVRDDFAGDSGSISGGWSLTITTDGDYTPASGTLTFPAGITSRTLDVPVIGDPTTESDETFSVNLTNPSGATIADGQGVGTILNDDCADSDGDRLCDTWETGTGTWVSSTDTGTSPIDADTDGDGLRDGDEVLGTLGGLDLPALGVSPLKKNILLEYDWFDDNLDPGTCGAHSHQPTSAIVNRVVASFAAATVSNPDGTTGIAVIQDYGQGGVFSGGNLVPDADGVIHGGVNDAEFQSIKTSHFVASRQGYFHYVLMPHRYNTNSGSSGQAELPGNDLIVSLQCYGSTTNVANTVMHELGHNLNLRHGGDEDCNWKPNYNSVMNYRFQFPGVDTSCNAVGNSGESNVLDFSTGSRIALDEANLNENAGTCGSTAIDWNFVNGLEASIAYDLNRTSDAPNASTGVDNFGCSAVTTTLNDHDDWANIVFDGLVDGDTLLPSPRQIVDCENPTLPKTVPGRE